ncbi:MAG: hypothetical protein JWL64_843 [Frankiales bacterium]|nr:hypothetical protein [Frankiales bacterium]
MITTRWGPLPVVADVGPDGQWYAVLRDRLPDGRLLLGAKGPCRDSALALLRAQCEQAAALR